MANSSRRRIEGLLDGVHVPSPLDVDALTRQIAAKRGRPIILRPKDDDTAAGPCGLWVSLDDVDVVFYEPGTSKLHRDHIVLHELSHVLCAHTPREALPEYVVGRLFPSLDPHTVRKVMGRSFYTAPEEREAEHLASSIVQRAGGAFAERVPEARPAPGGTDDGPREDHDAVERLSVTFGAAGRGRA